MRSIRHLSGRLDEPSKHQQGGRDTETDNCLSSDAAGDLSGIHFGGSLRVRSSRGNQIDAAMAEGMAPTEAAQSQEQTATYAMGFESLDGILAACGIEFAGTGQERANRTLIASNQKDQSHCQAARHPSITIG